MPIKTPKSISTHSRKNKNSKRTDNEQKPVPEKVLQLLERRRKRLVKKIIALEAETNIANKQAYNKRLKSMKLTLQSLESQLEENHFVLIKDLKKRLKTEPLELVEEIDELSKRSELDELKRRLKEQVLEAARRRKELGKINYSLAIPA